MNVRFETCKHIFTFQKYLNKLIMCLQRRLISHDRSKLEPPEDEIFEKHTEELLGLTYGSPEYFRMWDKMKPAFDHHYQNNRHHPEFAKQTKEEWKPVYNYPQYLVSNFGEVKRLDGKLRKPYLTPKGYLRIQLVNDTKKKNIFVHRLVANTFIPNPQNLKEVNHINGNKQDNRISNLEWVSSSQNLQHAYNTGLKRAKVKYVVSCKELNITTIGIQKMEKKLNELGYKVTASSIWNSINKGGSSHDLHFVGYRIEQNKPASKLLDMTLVDLLEMICDWKAASLRHADGNILKSININQQRFNFSDELKQIFINTVKELETE